MRMRRERRYDRFTGGEGGEKIKKRLNNATRKLWGGVPTKRVPHKSDGT